MNLLTLSVLAIGVVSTCAFHAAVQGDKFYCIVFEGNVTGTINYRSHETNATAALDFAINDVDVKGVTGRCYHTDENVTAETLSISFKPYDKPTLQEWKLELLFKSENDNNQNFKIANMTLIAVLPMNTTSYIEKYTLTDGNGSWSASDANGYTCSSSKFNLDEGSSLTFHDFRVLAFAHIIAPIFPKGQVFEQCAADVTTSELVPIIVGACLAGLVIVVLIAYLIGRSRAKRAGYSSV